MAQTKQVHHANGGPRLVMSECAHCHEPRAQHAGNDGRLYCNEFCEEGGPADRRRLN